MKVLDAFCCEGGAGAGYLRAGFEVTGVDLQGKFGKRYPGNFVQSDAVAYIRDHGHEFDLIHASPPCQGYTVGNRGRVTDWPRLIPGVREALQDTGKPYVIENVAGARDEMNNPVELCGCMFDLKTRDTDGVLLHLQRMRLFESNFPIPRRPHDHSDHKWVAGSYRGARRDKYEAKYVRKGGYVPKEKEVVKRLLGVEHDMTWNGLFECIPPVYSEFIGRVFLEERKGE